MTTSRTTITMLQQMLSLLPNTDEAQKVLEVMTALENYNDAVMAAQNQAIQKLNQDMMSVFTISMASFTDVANQMTSFFNAVPNLQGTIGSSDSPATAMPAAPASPSNQNAAPPASDGASASGLEALFDSIILSGTDFDGALDLPT